MLSGAKDGRAGVEEESNSSGNSSSSAAAAASVPPPWMVVPNPASMAELSSVPADQLAGGATAAQFFLQQQHQQAFGHSAFPHHSHSHNPPAGYPTTLPAAFPPGIAPVPAPYSHFREQGSLNGSHSGATDGAFLPRVTSLDMLNSIAQMGSSTGSLENLGAGDASALKQQQMQHLRLMQSYGGGGGGGVGGARSADPTPDVFPGLALAPNSSTLTLGDSVGWPSFGNLGSLGGGGSMDDLLSAGILSRQVSGGSPIDLGSGSGSHKFLPKASSLAVDEGSVGYPLEDSNPGNPGNPGMMGVSHAGDAAAMGPSAASSAQVRIKAPIVDMSAMSSRHGAARANPLHGQHEYHSGSRGDHGGGGSGDGRSAGAEERLFGNSNAVRLICYPSCCSACFSHITYRLFLFVRRSQNLADSTVLLRQSPRMGPSRTSGESGEPLLRVIFLLTICNPTPPFPLQDAGEHGRPAPAGAERALADGVVAAGARLCRLCRRRRCCKCFRVRCWVFFLNRRRTCCES